MHQTIASYHEHIDGHRAGLTRTDGEWMEICDQGNGWWWLTIERSSGNTYRLEAQGEHREYDWQMIDLSQFGCIISLRQQYRTITNELVQCSELQVSLWYKAISMYNILRHWSLHNLHNKCTITQYMNERVNTIAKQLMTCSKII